MNASSKEQNLFEIEILKSFFSYLYVVMYPY